MNKKLIDTLLVLSFPLAAIAIQSGQGDSGLLDKSQRIEHVIKELGLNGELKAKVESVFNKQKKKFKAMREENKPI